MSQWELKENPTCLKRGKTRATNWLIECSEFSRRITARSKAKTEQCRITFHTQLKIALMLEHIPKYLASDDIRSIVGKTWLQ